MVDRKLLIGLLGTFLLLLGVFAPMVNFSVPGINGSINVSYFALRNVDLIQYGGTDGIFILIIAIVSGILVFCRKYKLLYITGFVSLGTICSTCFTIHNQLSKLGLAGNLLESCIQLQWGCILLAIGSIMTIASAYMGTDKLNDV